MESINTTQISLNFDKELALIKTPEIIDIVKQGLAAVPAYFYTIPASSTGKYHPKYALGEGGLYRHVKAVIMIATELFRMDMFSFSQREQDQIIASLILHDCWKQGLAGGQYTTFDHPRIAAQELMKAVTIDPASSAVEDLQTICSNIESHMGQWNTDTHPKDPNAPLPPLPVPVTTMQKFVHLCDYIASRKQLEVTLE